MLLSEYKLICGRQEYSGLKSVLFFNLKRIFNENDIKKKNTMCGFVINNFTFQTRPYENGQVLLYIKMYIAVHMQVENCNSTSECSLVYYLYNIQHLIISVYTV